ncbi:3-hydroxyacyl-CoA dehydrogenase NAD-binding domain-containing protein, partial [Pseudomonas aeruginosa]|uniref:3-hydroxyacyl-CoA dehydrogenase NAD-binding domain-containing protein n=1 Tax=Pseudomonas aeruginosa TaxID=287 RepID=UPI003F82199A
GGGVLAGFVMAWVVGGLVVGGRVEAYSAAGAMGNLRVVEDLRVLRGCELVIEAIVENLQATQALFGQL